MRAFRLTFGKVFTATMLYLFAAAVVLPNKSPAIAIAFVVFGILLLITTPILLFIYFKAAWKKWSVVPNRTSYAIWLGLETFAALSIVSLLFYATLLHATTAN